MWWPVTYRNDFSTCVCVYMYVYVCMYVCVCRHTIQLWRNDSLLQVAMLAVYVVTDKTFSATGAKYSLLLHDD